MLIHRTVPVVAVLLSFGHAAAAAQIISFQKAGDKQIACLHTGLSSDLSDCGSRSDSYSYVFVGLITAVKPDKNDEKQLQVVPEEVFHGAPEAPLTVMTSQAPCLPNMAVVDRWLFYLRKNVGEPIVLDYYGNDSRPAAGAREEIETLHRLKSIGNFAILRGRVFSGEPFNGSTIPRARIVARRQSGSMEFATTADTNGRYEFQPLPPGEYKITVDPGAFPKPDGSSISVQAGACWDLTLHRSPHARIAGRVRRSDSSPLVGVDVVLMSSDNSWYLTTQTDDKGHFAFESQGPGEFVVGLNFPASPDWFNGGGGGAGVKLPPASLFYPGVARRSDARVIKLATDEKLDNVDFVVPSR